MKLGQDKTVAEIITRLGAAKDGEGAVKVAGTWGSFAHLLAVHVSKQLDRPILYISAHIESADKTADDLQAFGAKAIPMR